MIPPLFEVEGPCPCCHHTPVPTVTKPNQIRTRLKRAQSFYFVHNEVTYFVNRGGGAYTVDPETDKYCHYAGRVKTVLEKQPQPKEMGSVVKTVARKRKK